MNKIRLGLIIVLLGNALYAQQGIYTSKGKIINGNALIIALLCLIRAMVNKLSVRKNIIIRMFLATLSI
jgi:hypothetical protein